MNKKTDKEIPDLEIDVRETFDIDIDLKVMAFKESNEYVPVSMNLINSIKILL